jgi:plastocyanin
MNSRNTMMLGIGVAIALVISAGVAYGMIGQTAFRQGTYTSSLTGGSGFGGGMMGGISTTTTQQGTNSGGVTGASGYGGGMMGGYGGSSYQGGMMGGYGQSTYPGGIMGGGFGGMMGSFGGMMSGFGGMMSQLSQYMGNYANHMQNWRANGTFVAIVNYGFYPASLTVPTGTTVTWVNMDFVQHTVTAGTEQAPTNLFDSHELNHMQSFSYTFSAPGTFTYYCDVHPNMIGTVTVTG